MTGCIFHYFKCDTTKTTLANLSLLSHLYDVLARPPPKPELFYEGTVKCICRYRTIFYGSVRQVELHVPGTLRVLVQRVQVVREHSSTQHGAHGLHSSVRTSMYDDRLFKYRLTRSVRVIVFRIFIPPSPPSPDATLSQQASANFVVFLARYLPRSLHAFSGPLRAQTSLPRSFPWREGCRSGPFFFCLSPRGFLSLV